MEKHKSHENKRPVSINYADINKILVSNIVDFGDQDFKYLIGYKDSIKNSTLCIFP